MSTAHIPYHCLLTVLQIKFLIACLFQNTKTQLEWAIAMYNISKLHPCMAAQTGCICVWNHKVVMEMFMVGSCQSQRG